MRDLAFAIAFATAIVSPADGRTTPVRPTQSRMTARELIGAAMAATGGEAKLRTIGIARIRVMRTRNALEQSIRPEGPYIDTVDDLVETRRFQHPALRDDIRSRGFAADWVNGAGWIASGSLVSAGEAFSTRNGSTAPGSYAAVQTAEESLALGPERLLLTAADAPDLHLEAPAMLHDFEHDVVGFTWRGSPVRLYLEPVSHMPAAVEITRPRPYHIFWSPWGDVSTRTSFDVWMIEANGIRYPRRWTVEGNGRVAESWFVDGVEFDPPDAGALDASADMIAKARATHHLIEEIALPDPSQAITVAPGITLRPGAWNVTEVATPSGTWVIEAPIANHYSEQVIREVAASGRKLAGVITTSDSWPHIGGLRQYVARRVPIVALNLNVPVLKRLFATPHRQAPDLLETTRAAPILRAVSGDQWLGDGPNRMRLMPFRTVTGERQFAIWWPAHRLLYTSDLFTVNADGSVFLPQYLAEASDLVRREKLDVRTVFGMHYGPSDWRALVGKLDDRPKDGPR